MTTKHWSAFLLLGLIWGTSFLWIKVGLRELSPLTLVGFRLLFGWLAMAILVALRRPTFPRWGRTWFWLILMGVTNTALPFLLITWGEQSVDFELWPPSSTAACRSSRWSSHISSWPMSP